MMTKTHSFYSLGNSPWPLITSISALNLALSTITLMKFSNLENNIVSLVMIIMVSLSWWLTVKTELNKTGTNTNPLESSFKLSMLLFISSEILFFFSMFWAYKHFNLVPEMEIGSLWPPVMIKMFDSSTIPILNTLILLTSGVTLTIAHKMMMMKKKNKFIMMKMTTLILGLMFSVLQYSEYTNSFFSMTDSTFGTTFFLLTGFHGIHVIIGTLYLALVSNNCLFTNTSKENLSFEMSAWYWHFVDVVWMLVFYILYYLNN